MKLLILLGLSLSCFLSPVTDAALAQCSLIGKWMNDLGSNMTITEVSQNGGFSGTYLTAVTATNNTILESPLIGYQKVNGESLFGFTVKWEFSESITVFTGQCFNNGDNDRVLMTTWLLRSNADNVLDNWKQTLVGTNIFHLISEKPTTNPEN